MNLTEIETWLTLIHFVSLLYSLTLFLDTG